MRAEFYRRAWMSSLLGALLLSACGVGRPPPADSPPIDESHCLRIAEETLDFGPVTASCGYRDRTVTVLNRCSIPVAFSASLSAELASSFSLIAPSKTEVPANGWSLFQVRFIPSAPGDFTGTVVVRHAQQELSVSIAGQSIDGTKPFAEDWLMPKAKNAVDYLFVIDNSPAMAGHEESLKQNFAAVLRFMQSDGYDFHIAVTTTDVTATGEQGRFLPLDDSEPRVLTNETPDLESLFARRVQVGYGGSSETAGLEAARRALNPAMLASHNGSFLRNGAFLSIIVVSAGEDNSSDSFNAYYSALLDVKGRSRANEVSFSAVATGDIRKAGLYVLMSQRLGGTNTDIESDYWAKNLFIISGDGFSRRFYYSLSSLPSDPRAIRALINGVEVPSTQGNITNWWYEPEWNVAVFNTIAMPEPGMVLRFEYPVGCTASE